MLIVLEGVDASGKATQTKRLHAYLKEKNQNVLQITFPDYESDSSILVKKYLAGDFGKDADAVSPYAASSFYAIDRYASYKTKWEAVLAAGDTVICDRYVTSNMIHQSAKLSTDSEKDAYLDWLCDFEYEKLALPRPDIVFFLDMPPAYSAQLMEKRANKITGEMAKDIHEGNQNYMKKSYDAAIYVAKKYNWCIIPCVKDGIIRTIDEIHQDIVNITEGVMHAVLSNSTGR